MPVLDARSEPANDCWEGWEGAATTRPGRLMSLRALRWAAMPPAFADWMERSCPKVSLGREDAAEEGPEHGLTAWELEDTRCEGGAEVRRRWGGGGLWPGREAPHPTRCRERPRQVGCGALLHPHAHASQTALLCVAQGFPLAASGPWCEPDPLLPRRRWCCTLQRSSGWPGSLGRIGCERWQRKRPRTRPGAGCARPQQQSEPFMPGRTPCECQHARVGSREEHVVRGQTHASLRSPGHETDRMQHRTG